MNQIISEDRLIALDEHNTVKYGDLNEREAQLYAAGIREGEAKVSLVYNLLILATVTLYLVFIRP